MHLVIHDAVAAMGGYKKAAAVFPVAPVTVSKWMEDPADSGQPITIRHLQTMLAHAGENLTNLALQNAVDELIQDHFLGLCFRRAYPEERVFAVIEMLGFQAAPSRKAVNE